MSIAGEQDRGGFGKDGLIPVDVMSRRLFLFGGAATLVLAGCGGSDSGGQGEGTVASTDLAGGQDGQGGTPAGGTPEVPKADLPPECYAEQTTSELLKPPFNKTVKLVTVDRFNSWDGSNTDLTGPMMSWLSRIRTDNLMVRVVIDQAQPNEDPNLNYPEDDVFRLLEENIAGSIGLLPNTTIMYELVDSYYNPAEGAKGIQGYTLEEYAERARRAANIGTPDDVYEVGNEINGDWTGDPVDVVTKTAAAARKIREIHGADANTAITLHAGMGAEAIVAWVDQYISQGIPDGAELRQNTNFVSISYYPEDGAPVLNSATTEWLVAELANRFPKAAIGFSEMYASNTALLYQPGSPLQSTHERFVGGGGLWDLGELLQAGNNDAIAVAIESLSTKQQAKC